MLIRMLMVSVGLAAQPDIAQVVREARVEAVRGQTDQARKMLESAAPRCQHGGNKQSVDCMQLLLDLSELVANPAPLLEFASEAEASKEMSAEAAMRRGFLHVNKKEFDDAVTSFVVAERRDPRQAARSAIWIALAHTRSGKHDEAHRFIQSALSKAEGEQSAVIANVAAMLYDEMGRRDDATALRKSVRPVSANPRPARPEGTLRVGGDVSAPKVRQKVEPRYSEEARAAKYQGTVVLGIVIAETGVPRDVRVLRGIGLGLDERAMAAVAEWRFQPGMKDDMPVPVFATIEVNFRLL